MFTLQHPHSFCFSFFRQSVTKYLCQNGFWWKLSDKATKKPLNTKNTSNTACLHVSPPPTINAVLIAWKDHSKSCPLCVFCMEVRTWNKLLHAWFIYIIINIDCGGGGWRLYDIIWFFLVFWWFGKDLCHWLSENGETTISLLTRDPCANSSGRATKMSVGTIDRHWTLKFSKLP